MSAATVVPFEQPGDTPMRQSPQHIEAEQALLGAILVNNAAYGRVSEILRPEHFYQPLHQEIYAAIAELIDSNSIADNITVGANLPAANAVFSGHSHPYLVELMMSVVTIINSGDYARTIHDAYLRRRLIEVGTVAVNNAFDGGDAAQMLADAEEQLFALHSVGQQRRSEPVTLRQAALAAVAEIRAAHAAGKARGILTGLIDLDEKLGGLAPGNLVIIAGRASMGKSALARSIGEHMAREVPGGLFSLEMQNQEVGMTALAGPAGIDTVRMRNLRLNVHDLMALDAAAAAMPESSLYIHDRRGITMGELSRQARRLKRQHGIGFLIVDYLQLIASPQSRDQNRVNEVTAITMGLKALAGELQIPVIALSQLSRKVEERDDKRPMLSDLRESGSIEQDADTVIFIYREEYYLQRAEPQQAAKENNEKFTARIADWTAACERAKGVAELVIAKQRLGGLGTVKVRFNGPALRFENLYQGGVST